MAFPSGRILAVLAGRVYLLASDGWDPLASPRPHSARPLKRADAEALCRQLGHPITVLDSVPEADY
ncbi:hypothetical protein [Allokutzneria oryzae]|uniref:Uncharacterized protein n=1 Tax=Allokutzneria oryzae TaxID=1378989 RepID=A0ABV5ZUD5_9PSEU